MADLPRPHVSPQKARHFDDDFAHFNTTGADTLADAKAEIQGKVSQVSRQELEAFLSQAVRLFLQGGFYLHHDGQGWPNIEITVTEDTVILDLTNLARALNERRIASEKDEPVDRPGEQVLDRWRIFVKLEGEVVAALGRGIPGVQVRKGKAALILLTDLMKGYLGHGEARPEPTEREAPAAGPSPGTPAAPPARSGPAPYPVEQETEVPFATEPGTRDVPRRW